jgi:1,2-diacylglycerol 3-beta-galactosyltransferase
MSGVPRAVFLFSDTGAGHRTAAEAVAAALAIRHRDAFEVELLDPLSRERGRLAGRLTALYGPITRRAPFLWGAAYHATNFAPLVRMVQGTLGRGLRPRLRRIFKPRPTLVASFHPLLNHVARDVLPEGVPLVTVITDWIEFHQAWTDVRADRIVCPSPAAFALCLERGVPAQRLLLSGLPVHPKFLDAVQRLPDRRAARRALGLDPRMPTVLLVGGGDGTEPLHAYTRALSRLELQVLVVCGRNQRLYRRMEGERLPGVRLYGFVDNMPELMLAADLLVTRAGPGLIAEGLTCGCPLLLTGHLPGQETGNVRQVLELGIGRSVPSLKALVRAVSDWYALPQPAQEAARERARAAASPRAAFEIADLLIRVGRVAEPARL